MKDSDIKELYGELVEMDPEGWCVYQACKELLKVDVFKEFIVEDNLGWFEEANGYELMKYAEIATFGHMGYKIISSCYEVLDSYTLDKNSEDYQNYLTQLYPLAIDNINEKVLKNNKEVEEDEFDLEV